MCEKNRKMIEQLILNCVKKYNCNVYYIRREIRNHFCDIHISIAEIDNCLSKLMQNGTIRFNSIGEFEYCLKTL